MCKRRFTRKSNAFRHNSNVHDDLGTIVRDPFKLRSDKSRKKYVDKDSEIKQSYFSEYDVYKENDNPKDDYFEDLGHDSDDWKIYKILGQLIKPYAALEKEIENMNHIDKPVILSNSFISSLDSYNPVKSLNEIVDFYRSVKALDRISENLSIYKNVPMETAKIIIKESIRNCPLFHRINN